jgi:hypothetical protein
MKERIHKQTVYSHLQSFSNYHFPRILFSLNNLLCSVGLCHIYLNIKRRNIKDFQLNIQCIVQHWHMYIRHPEIPL